MSDCPYSDVLFVICFVCIVLFAGGGLCFVQGLLPVSCGLNRSPRRVVYGDSCCPGKIWFLGSHDLVCVFVCCTCGWFVPSLS